MSKYHVLVPTQAAPEMLLVMEQHPELHVVAPGNLSPQELAEALPPAHAVIIRSNNVITAELLRDAENLRVVGRAGTGVDNVDVAEATQQGVVVLNTPGANANATAEHTIAMMFALARNIPVAHGSLKRGEWERKRFVGIELRGRTLGLIGVGRVGTIVAERAQALGLTVLAYDPYLQPADDAGLPFRLVELPALLHAADLISVHTPLNGETRHLLGEDELAQLRPGALVLNCARGGIIDEAALCDAIENGQVAGAALDAYEIEPPLGRRVLELEQIITTPHLGGSTREAQMAVGRMIAEQVCDFLLQGEARNCVNREALEHL